MSDKMRYAIITLLISCLMLTAVTGFGNIEDEIKLLHTTVTCDNETTDVHVNFGHMDCKRVVKGFLRSQSVECINFEDNGIKHIDDGAFDGLPNMAYLNLAHNDILLKNQSFLGNHSKLTTLILDHNNVAEKRHKRYLRYCGKEKKFTRKDNLQFSDICDIGDPSSELYTWHFIEYIGAETIFHHHDYIDMDDLDCADPDMSVLKAISVMVFDEQDYISLNSLPELKYLYLRNVSLKHFFYDKLRHPKLTHLFLSDNELAMDKFVETIQNSSVTHLYLERNKLECAPNGSLHNIEVLALDGNFLTSPCCYGYLNRTCLENLPNLKYLSLAQNLITNIDTEMFVYNKQLVGLNLADNQISYFEHLAFSNMPNLIYLNLSLNSMASLPYFCPLKNLSTLILKDTNISIIPNNIFSCLQNLRKLDLSENAIENISAVVFDNLHLTNLDLSKNRLTTFSQWNTQKYLKFLYINDNSFTSFDQIFLSAAQQLEYLDISGNPLHLIKIQHLPVNVTINAISTSYLSPKCVCQN